MKDETGEKYLKKKLGRAGKQPHSMTYESTRGKSKRNNEKIQES